MSDLSPLERRFLSLWASFVSAQPLAESSLLPVAHYRYDSADRRRHFDFAWPEAKLAVEIQGGSFVNGRHIRPSGQAADFRKLNRAQAMGWVVLQANTPMLARGSAESFVELVYAVLKERLSQPTPSGGSGA